MVRWDRRTTHVAQTEQKHQNTETQMRKLKITELISLDGVIQQWHGEAFLCGGNPATLLRAHQNANNADRHHPQYLQGRRALKIG